MILLNATEEAFEIALMFPRTLVLVSLEGSVFDVCATMLAPILWLEEQSVKLW